MKQSMTPQIQCDQAITTSREYALSHWCDRAQRWEVPFHRFLTTTTHSQLVGQFIVSYWFDCPIYKGKTFMILQMPKGMKTRTIENIINSEQLQNNDLVKVLETFICPEINNNRVGGKYTSKISLEGVNPQSKLSLSLRETNLHRTRYPFYCTLPSFTLKN
jgi:hypothetical protein